jgi:hypothetical protein
VKRHEIVLLQGAQGDLLSIYATLGEKVYLQVDKSLSILRAFPEAGPTHFGERIRRLVVPKSYFGVFYSITGNRVLVGAVLDLRQSPRSLSKRLSQL